jgi:DNA-directed RNA polymerase subunit M/transcription elongation factor TFIIS
MTPDNPLALDVATRTTRGRACPRCGGKIIPSDRAIYQSSGNPDAIFPIWQCERCGYEEMSAQPKAKSKAEPAKPGKSVGAAGTDRATAALKPKAPAAMDLQGRPYPPDVLQLLERLKPAAPKDA